MKRLLSIAAAALVLSSGALAPAAAQSFAEDRSASVAYLDLNLDSRAGRATLERRVKYAIDRICGERPSPREMTRSKMHRGCVTAAREDSRAQLAELFAGKALASNMVRVPAR